MNQYEYMLNAIKVLNLPDIGACPCRRRSGILTFTRLPAYLLKYYHDLIVAVLTGIMLGTSKAAA